MGIFMYILVAINSGGDTYKAGLWRQICEMQRENEWTVVKDPDMNEPYAYYEGNKIWCGYEDAMSMWVKVRRWRIGWSGCG